MSEIMLPRNDKGVREISNSEIQTFKKCRRLWWLKYYRGLRRRDELPLGALATGTRIHAALEACYRPNGTLEDILPAMEAAIERDRLVIVDMFGSSFLLKEFTKVANLERTMVQGYVDWINETGQDSDLEIIGSEIKLSTTVRTSTKVVQIIGKIDILAKDHVAQEVCVIDTKTCKTFEEFIKTAHLLEQPMHYQLLTSCNLPEDQHANGAIFNMIKKVGRTARAKPPFYMRHRTHTSPKMLNAFEIRLVRVIEDILREEQRKRHLEHYPSPSYTCSWSCPFFNICTKFDDGSNIEGYLDAHFIVSDPNKYYDSDVDQ